MATDRLSFLGVLASEGIELRLGEDGRMRPNRRVEDPELDAWIRANREAIRRELEQQRDDERRP